MTNQADWPVYLWVTGVLKLYEDLLMSLDFIHLAQYLTKLPDTMSADDLFRCIEKIHMNIDNRKFHQVLASFREPKDTWQAENLV